MSVGFCPCAALDDACRRQQTAAVSTDSRQDVGSGDQQFLYYYDYYDYDDDLHIRKFRL